MTFLKDKFYFVLGAFVAFILIIVIVVACSAAGTDYESLENDMVNAAKTYYSEHSGKLPKKEDETYSVSLKFLIQNEYIKEIKDPENKNNLCDGKVEVTKRNHGYYYQGFLECGNNYKTEFLVDALKNSLKTDDNGNGLYKVNDEYIFKGDKVKNFVNFNDELWQVIKIDSEGDIKLIKWVPTEDAYPWDDRYNVTKDDETGINDFSKSRIRETLENYYKNNFNSIEGVKEKIKKKDFCIGNRKKTDDIKATAECASTMPLYVGLLNTSEFYIASIDAGCTAFGQQQCANYNFLARDYDTWTLNGMAEETDKIYVYYDEVEETYASNEKRIYPVIYIDKKTISRSGKGTEASPYLLKY